MILIKPQSSPQFCLFFQGDKLLSFKDSFKGLHGGLAPWKKRQHLKQLSVTPSQSHFCEIKHQCELWQGLLCLLEPGGATRRQDTSDVVEEDNNP